MHVRLRVAQILPLVALFAACFLNVAAGQPYRADTVDRRAITHKTAVLDSVNNPAIYATAKDGPIPEYFNSWFFPSMTQTEPDALNKLASLFRDGLFKSYLWASNNPDFQKQITQLTYTAMGRIVVSDPGNPPQPPYHPSVRYNAVLILGQLDDQYAGEAGGAAVPAKPHAGANNALSAIVDSATTTGRFPAPLVYGALIGLERHALLKQSLPPAAVDKMTSAAMKIVTRDEPVLGLTPDVYAMTRLRAGSVLAQLGNLGKNNEVYTAVLQLVTKLPSIEDRCEAATLVAVLIGKNKPEGLKVDSAMTADQLLKLATAVADAEFARAIEFEQKQAGGFGAGGGSGGRTPGGGGRSFRRETTSSLSDTKETFPRRTLVNHLERLKLALTATKPLVAEDVQAKFTQVLSAIEPVIQQAKDTETIELVVADAVRNMRNVILRVAPPAGAAATPTTAAAPTALDAK